MTPRVLVWNEFFHERRDPEVTRHYPDGIHVTLAAALRSHGLEARTATLDDPAQGLDDAALDWADALVWWGHKRHADVTDETLARVVARVHGGTGFVALHSAHYSRPFRALMGAPCTLVWNDDGFRERLTVVDPTHPIAAGLPPSFELAAEEMYGEPFGIPQPEALVLTGWFASGHGFRSACAWTRGLGRVAYLQPGHETFPTYHDANVQRLVANAASWCANRNRGPAPANRRVE